MRRISGFLAAMCATAFVSTAFGQSTTTWPSESTACQEVLHPVGRPTQRDLRHAERATTDGRRALIGLPEIADDAQRLAVRLLFQEAHRLAGNPSMAYNHALALRRIGEKRVALHIFVCLRDSSPDFGTLSDDAQTTVRDSISALERDIAAMDALARPSPLVDPRPPVRVVVVPDVPPRIIPVIPPRIIPPPVTVTPHPRSLTLRTTGQVLVGAGLASLVGASIAAVLYNHDHAALEAANSGNASWSQPVADREQMLSILTPTAFAVGGALVASGVGLWLYGNHSVSDTPALPIVSVIPTTDGVQANALVRF